jgi:hypothetical protein
MSNLSIGTCLLCIPEANINPSITPALLNPLSPASEYKVDPLLLAKGSITIGYGAGDDKPLVFNPAEGQNVDIGFLKLFLSTEYVDLSDIAQESPFTTGIPRSISRARTTKLSTWDTILVSVVIQSRKGAAKARL